MTEARADSTEQAAEARLSKMERQVAAQAAALRKVPLNMPVPRSVIALLATAPGTLSGLTMPERHRPRVTRLLGEIQAMTDDLNLRRRELAGRIATVRAARRAGPAAHLVDCTG
jgi:hypothetical protein